MKKLKSISVILGLGILLTPISVGAQSFKEEEINGMLCKDDLSSDTESSFYGDRISVIASYIKMCEDRRSNFEGLKSRILRELRQQGSHHFLNIEVRLVECSENYEECLFSLRALLNVYKTAKRSVYLPRRIRFNYQSVGLNQ